MLRWRLVTSALAIPAFIGICVLDHREGASAPYLLVLCAAIAVRCVDELTTLLRASPSMRPRLLPTTFLTIAVIFAGWVAQVDFKFSQLIRSGVGSHTDLQPIAVMTALSVLILFFLAIMRYRAPGGNVETLAAEVFIVCYIGLFLSMTAQLRWVAGPRLGYLAIGSLVIAAKFGDIGAYTLGRLWGRKKMCPLLSPGKTWMGGLGALLGASLGALGWFELATRQFDSRLFGCRWYWAVLYGGLIGLAGLIGDLCESMIKRDVAQKDAAHVLPGFGGLLDLLDSVLFAGPIAYILWRLLPLAV